MGMNVAPQHQPHLQHPRAAPAVREGRAATTGGRGAMPADGFTDGTISKEASDDGKAVSLWELSAALVGCQ